MEACPFCGFQRSVASLLRGDLKTSFLIYPALFPMLLSVAGLLLFRTAKQRERYLKWAILIDAILMIMGAALKNTGVIMQ